MQIIFYKYNKENNVVDKTNYLLNALTVNGNMRENCNISIPQFDIQFDPTLLQELLQRNYCYVSDLHRYYFITTIDFKYSNIVTFSLTCDVLYSFKDDILNLDCFIDRQEFEYNPYLTDTFIPNTAKTIETVNYVSTQDYFKTYYDLSGSDYCYAMTFTAEYEFSDKDSSFLHPNSLTTVTYVLNQYQIDVIINFLYNEELDVVDPARWFGNIRSGIINLKIYPFNLASSLSGLDMYPCDPSKDDIITTMFVLKNYNNPDGAGWRLPKDFGTFYRIFKSTDINFKFSILNPLEDMITKSFIDYEPYSIYDLYLPYYGYISLPPSILIKKDDKNVHLYIDYFIDIITNSCSIYVTVDKIGEPNQIIFSTQINLGSSIPLVEDNRGELIRNTTIGMIKNIGSIIATTATMGVPIPAFGKHSSTINTIRENNLNLEKASVISKGILDIGSDFATQGNLRKVNTNSSGETLCDNHHTGIFIVLRRKDILNNIIDNPVYLKNYGRPCGKSYKLRNLNGFTIISKSHIENIKYALSTEREEIENLLTSGVILPYNEEHPDIDETPSN